MAHSKPYVRKKAVLAMYKLFVAYPQGLRLTFDKLRDKLNDAEATVQETSPNARVYIFACSALMYACFKLLCMFSWGAIRYAMFVRAPRA